MTTTATKPPAVSAPMLNLDPVPFVQDQLWRYMVMAWVPFVVVFTVHQFLHHTLEWRVGVPKQFEGPGREPHFTMNPGIASSGGAMR